MAHIKDLTPDTMTVFITEPFYWESMLRNLPYTAGDNDRFTYDGEWLTARGYGRAKEALENMTNVALFYVAHKDELRRFYAEYDTEYARLSQICETVKERKRAITENKVRLALIRQQFEIEESMMRLFLKMYRRYFREDDPVICQEMFENLEACEGL